MHEMSLCESILHILEQEALRQTFQHVHRIRLEIGTLACVETTALRFCFEVIARGTLAEGAQLEMIECPATAWCLGCMQYVKIPQRFSPCPECGSHQLQVTQGEELRIKDLEVE